MRFSTLTCLCYNRIVGKGIVASEAMMTARQVAELLGVHENWVYDQAVAGVLPSYKIGGSRRIDPADVDEFLLPRKDEA